MEALRWKKKSRVWVCSMKREIKGPDDPNSSTEQYVKITRLSATPKIYLADRGSQHLTFEVTFSPLRTVTV